MKHLLLLFFAINFFAAFNQSTVTIYKKRPAEFELINYSKISRSAASDALLDKYKINEKIDAILTKYGTLKVQTFNPYKVDLTANKDSTVLVEYTIIKENFTQTIKERTTILKQASGDNSVFYSEANGELTLKVRLIDAKTNQLIVEKQYTSTTTKKGAETDYRRDAAEVDLVTLSKQCTEEIGFAFLKFVSNWNEQITIEFEEDNKFVELPVVIKSMNTNNWSASIEILKKYTEDPNFKSKQKAKALHNYGLVLMYDDQFDKAKEAFKAAVTLSPKETIYENKYNQVEQEHNLKQLLINREKKRDIEFKKGIVEAEKAKIAEQAEIEHQKVIQDSLVLIQKIQSDSIAEVQKQNAAEKQKIEDDFVKGYNTSVKSNPSLYTNQSGAVSCVKSFMTYAGDGNLSGMKSISEKPEDNEKRKEVGSYGVLRILGGYDRDPVKAKNEFAKIKSSSLKNPAVYYLSSSTAIVLASKWGTDPYAKGFYFYVGKIGSSWKVLGMDDSVFLRGNTLSLDQKQLIEKTLMKRAKETN
jgi:tetratricopeptide (TPR) repeat protein